MSQQQWTGEVIEEDGELFLVFPEEMLTELGWEPGDTIVWDFPDGRNVVIARKARPDELQPDQ
jgi:hypothetical protein